MISEKKGILITLAIGFVFSFSLADCARRPAEPGPGEQMSRAPEGSPERPGEVEEFTPPARQVPQPEEQKPVVREPAREMASFDVSDLADVFFAFDRSDLTPEAKDRLARDARLLKAAPRVNVIVEGHCDERGTSEYNLGLGERRASAVKNYLVSLGVSPSRIKTISYGEEKPFAVGHSEAAWRQNRRAHFALQ